MAAITHAVGIGIDVVSDTSFNSGPFTPAANDLLVVFVNGSGTKAAGTLASSVSGKTFSQVTTADYGSTSRAYCFVSDQLASNEEQSVTFDCTGDAAGGACISVERIAGITRTGLDAILQSEIDNLNGTNTTPEVVFAASVLTGNPTLGGVASSSTTDQVEPTDWTELSQLVHVNPTSELETVGRNSGFTGDTITWGSVNTGVSCAIAVEIDASADDAVTPRLALLGVGV